MKKLSIYIHIPFCKSKCKYCDFVSAPADCKTKEKYIKALINEINGFNADGFTVDTIFIGGGTPSSLDDGVLSCVISVVRNKFKCEIMEFTVECNPNSLTLSKLEEYKQCGVTRISLGVQSLNDDILRTIGRSHNKPQALTALKLLRNSDLDFSVDLMIGLPHQTMNIVLKDLEEIMKYGACHISCYSLILEKDTPIYDMVTDGGLTLPSEDETVDMYNAVYSKLSEYGLNRYEISNFGKPCLHNVGYWTLHNYAGFGVNAHSFVNNVRYYNVNDINEYINLYGDTVNNKDNKNNHYIIEEYLTDRDCVIELMMLGLRMDKGVSIADIANYGKEYLDKILIIADKLKKYLIISDTYIAVKSEYTYVSNSIIQEFISI